MGPLYWETPTEIVEQVVNSETLPIEAAAARVTELLEQRREDEADTA
jgi:hypothetical protein